MSSNTAENKDDDPNFSSQSRSESSTSVSAGGRKANQTPLTPVAPIGDRKVDLTTSVGDLAPFDGRKACLVPSGLDSRKVSLRRRA